MIEGPCVHEHAGFPLHHPYAGSQLQDALKVIAEGAGAVRRITARIGARFADPLPYFNPPGRGEQATICLLTNMCTPLRDIHPTTRGYRVLARVIKGQYLRELAEGRRGGL